MKKRLAPLALAAAMAVAPAFAHHPAADIVDEEVYAMIDALVADTPHADLTFEDMGGGMTSMTITADSADTLGDLMDDGGLDYVQMLDGESYVNVQFNDDGSATMTVETYPR